MNESPSTPPAPPPGLRLQHDAAGAPAQTELGSNLLIDCPRYPGYARAAAKCTACGFFNGVLDTSPGNALLRFDERYRVICLHPTMRRVRPMAD
jgi:hypothetical protein